MDADDHIRALKVDALHKAAAELHRRAVEGIDSEMNTVRSVQLSARADRIAAGEDDHTGFPPDTFTGQT